MEFKLRKMPGILFALVAGGLIFVFSFWGINFSLQEPQFHTLRLMMLIPAYLLLAIFGYLFLSSLNMGYRIEDDGLHIRWGIRSIVIPWNEIEALVNVKGRSNLYSIFGASWPGYMIGLYMARGIGSVRMYATYPWQGFIYVKSSKGFFGLTPVSEDYQKMLDIIASKSGKDIEVVDMDKLDPEIKGEDMYADSFYRIIYRLNLAFLIIFALYLAIFFPGSGAPPFTVLLLVLAVALFFFNMGNAGRLFQFSGTGAHILLIIGIAVTGIFMILALSEIHLR